MAKRTDTTENRVYLFRDLARAYVEAHGDGLGDPARRSSALAALADLAAVSAIVSDGGALGAAELATRIRALESTATAAPRAPEAAGPRSSLAKRSRGR